MCPFSKIEKSENHSTLKYTILPIRDSSMYKKSILANLPSNSQSDVFHEMITKFRVLVVCAV